MKKIKGIYLIEFDGFGVKIGISNDIKTRVDTYLSPWCKDVSNIWAIECEYPRLLEKKVIDKFKKHVIFNSSEFLSLINIEELKKFIHEFRFTKHQGMISSSYYLKIEGWVKLYPTEEFPNKIKPIRIKVNGKPVVKKIATPLSKKIGWG